jgi:hypothetical protein
VTGAHYKLYFTEADGGFCGVEDFAADSDAEAIATARRLVANSPHGSGELWQQARRIALVEARDRADPAARPDQAQA